MSSLCRRSVTNYLQTRPCFHYTNITISNPEQQSMTQYNSNVHAQPRHVKPFNWHHNANMDFLCVPQHESGDLCLCKLMLNHCSTTYMYMVYAQLVQKIVPDTTTKRPQHIKSQHITSTYREHIQIIHITCTYIFKMHVHFISKYRMPVAFLETQFVPLNPLGAMTIKGSWHVYRVRFPENVYGTACTEHVSFPG